MPEKNKTIRFSKGEKAMQRQRRMWFIVPVLCLVCFGTMELV
jgi:hypothetical protein